MRATIFCAMLGSGLAAALIAAIVFRFVSSSEARWLWADGLSIVAVLAAVLTEQVLLRSRRFGRPNGG